MLKHTELENNYLEKQSIYLLTIHTFLCFTITALALAYIRNIIDHNFFCIYALMTLMTTHIDPFCIIW